MGVKRSDDERARGYEEMKVPAPMVALLRRLMGLPAGVHHVTVVKSRAGAAGVEGWAVTEAKMERAGR